MAVPPRLVTERERLQRLAQTGILVGALPDFVPGFLEALAQQFNVSKCLLTVVGDIYQHIVASVGFEATLTRRDHAFCAYTILSDDVMVVDDALLDARFADNPYVTQEPHIRFYAGAPLITIDGHRLGSLCLIEDTPRILSASERVQLAHAARSLSARLGFLDRVDEFSHFTSEDLARMIRMQFGAVETTLLMKLVEALTVRLRIA